MNLSKRIVSYGLFAAATACAVGAIGLVATRQQALALDDVLTATSSVRSSMDADMMHDAVRADVMATLLGSARPGAEAGADDARKALAEHGRRLLDSLGHLSGQPLPAAVKQTSAATLLLARRYVDAADAVQKAAFGGAGGVDAALPEFERRFGELESRWNISATRSRRSPRRRATPARPPPTRPGARSSRQCSPRWPRSASARPRWR